jgi:hypothetical protein
MVVAVLEADEVDRDNQHDHEPGGERIEGLVRAEVPVRQHGQDHERDQHEAHDDLEIAVTQLFHPAVQRLLPVQQHHDRTAEHDAWQPVSGDGGRSKQVHDECGNQRGDAFLLAAVDVQDQDEAQRQQADRDEPAAGVR